MTPAQAPQAIPQTPPTVLLGRTIRMMRESHRVGLRELAGMVEVSPSHLSRVESGERAAAPELYERLIAVIASLPAPGERGMSTKTVRTEQHGTTTGYAYGCRCHPCRNARRTQGPPRVSAESLERIYAALEHEADMDGIVTASGSRLGELTGLSDVSANLAIHQLAAAGRVKVTGSSLGRGGVLIVDLGVTP